MTGLTVSGVAKLVFIFRLRSVNIDSPVMAVPKVGKLEVRFGAMRQRAILAHVQDIGLFDVLVSSVQGCQ